MHLSKEIETFLERVSCDHSERVFDHVWPKIDLSIFELFVLKHILFCECLIDGATVEATAEHLPRKNFFLFSLGEIPNIVETLVLHTDSLATKFI